MTDRKIDIDIKSVIETLTISVCGFDVKVLKGRIYSFKKCPKAFLKVVFRLTREYMI